MISFGLPQPEYEGECDFVLFKDRQEFYNLVECAPRNEAWIVFYYACWASDCGQFTPIFCDLSLNFASKNLKFGKLDVSICPGYAKKYNVSIKSTTKQLPTLLLIKNGQEILRMPDFIDTEKTKVKKLPLKYDTIVEFFKLKEYSHGKTNTNTITNTNDTKSKNSKNDKIQSPKSKKGKKKKR